MRIVCLGGFSERGEFGKLFEGDHYEVKIVHISPSLFEANIGFRCLVFIIECRNL